MLQERRRQGKPTPALDRMPKIPEYLLFWYTDFITLSRSRTSGMGNNPIDITSMINYAEKVAGMQAYELPTFIRVIQYLDSILLEHSAKKNKATKK